MTFAVGSLVKARGREWVVLPESLDRAAGCNLPMVALGYSMQNAMEDFTTFGDGAFVAQLPSLTTGKLSIGFNQDFAASSRSFAMVAADVRRL